MDRLGPTIAHIAREKAAIIERGDLAVTGATGEALAIVRRRARRLDVPLTVVEPAPILGMDRDGLEVGCPGSARPGSGCAAATRRRTSRSPTRSSTRSMRPASPSVGPAERRRGYAEARWPGRLELLDVDGHDVLLDGAHNPAGAAALAVALDDLRPWLAPEPTTLVMAADGGQGRRRGHRARSARPTTIRGATVIATTLDVPRALARATWRRSGWPSGSRRSRRSTIRSPPSIARLGRPGTTVVAGSLYLVGTARAHLIDDPALRDPPTGETAP